MVAKGGAKLIDIKAIKILKSELVKKVSLITPNIPDGPRTSCASPRGGRAGAGTTA